MLIIKEYCVKEQPAGNTLTEQYIFCQVIWFEFTIDCFEKAFINQNTTFWIDLEGSLCSLPEERLRLEYAPKRQARPLLSSHWKKQKLASCKANPTSPPSYGSRNGQYWIVTRQNEVLNWWHLSLVGQRHKKRGQTEQSVVCGNTHRDVYDQE